MARQQVRRLAHAGTWDLLLTLSTVLTITAAIWLQVEYRVKQFVPWKILMTGGPRSFDALSIDYFEPYSPVVFITSLGTDDFGDRALENLAREKIDVDLVRRVPGAPSGVALICVDDRGENSIAVAAGANGELRPEDVEPLARVLGEGDVVLLQLEIPLQTVEAAARLAATCEARLILNPAPARMLPDTLLSHVSLITPNEGEAGKLTGVDLSDEVALT